jgi:hypothetical protein
MATTGNVTTVGRSRSLRGPRCSGTATPSIVLRRRQQLTPSRLAYQSTGVIYGDIGTRYRTLSCPP